MPTVTLIDDPTDPRVAVYVGLTDHQLRIARERREPALRAVFIVEGDRLIAETLEHGVELVSILRSPDRPAAVEERLPDHVPVYTAGPEVAVRLTGMHIHRGTLACFARPPERHLGELLVGPHPRSLVLAERVINPTNLGVITRSAAGLGMDGLVVDPESCDPLYRRAYRVAMGASLRLPWARVRDLSAALRALGESGFTVAALTPEPTALDIARLPPLERVALVLGNEGTGLTPDTVDAAHLRIRIPMARGVDSLNVGAAAAIACFAVLGALRR